MGTLVIAGAGGVLGAKLVAAALVRTDDTILALTHGGVPAIRAANSARVLWQSVDISDRDALRLAIAEVHPHTVINAAAMTNVDACESRRAAAHAANAAGPHFLAEACVATGARLLHVSTDYVFPGDSRNPGPYGEDARVAPVNYYGQTKLLGERAVQQVCGNHVPWLVARTALVYGQIPGGRVNFILWLAGELRAGRRVRIVHDQINTPTLAEDLAVALLALAERGTQGIIHLAGPDLIARDEWARRIASYYQLDASLIDLVSTAELGQQAVRPLRSGLVSQRSADLAGITMRGVLAGLVALEETPARE